MTCRPLSHPVRYVNGAKRVVTDRVAEMTSQHLNCYTNHQTSFGAILQTEVQLFVQQSFIVFEEEKMLSVKGIYVIRNIFGFLKGFFSLCQALFSLPFITSSLHIMTFPHMTFSHVTFSHVTLLQMTFPCMIFSHMKCA